MTSKRRIDNVRDENLVFLIYDVGGRANSMHDRLIAHIVECLHRKGYRKINYDHVKEFVEKSNVPLKLAGRRWDIVVEVGNNRYAAIEIKMFKLSGENGNSES